AAYVLFLAAFVLLLGRRTRSAPSPLAGEGWGGGSCDVSHVPPPRIHRATPTPNPSPQGGGEHTEFAAREDVDARAQRGPDEAAGGGFGRAFAAGLLFALALAVRPNIAPAAGILLAGGGIMALAAGEFRRVAGLTLGFAAVLAMALHNWVYGGVLVLFTTTA